MDFIRRVADISGLGDHTFSSEGDSLQLLLSLPAILTMFSSDKRLSACLCLSRPHDAMKILTCADIKAGHTKPINPTYDGARMETEVALSISIAKLLAKTKTHPWEVCMTGCS